MPGREPRSGFLRVNRGIQNVLVIHQGALGDFICCLPALACLRVGLPEADVTLMGYPRVLEAVNGRYYADRIVSVDRSDVALLYQERLEYPTHLSGFFGAFDLIVVVGSSQSPLSKNLRRICRGQIVAVPSFPPVTSSVHMVDHFLSLPRSLGLAVQEDTPRLHLLEEDRDVAAAFLQDHGMLRDRPLIAVHPGSGSHAKIWPLERFRALAHRLVEAYEAGILLVVGPGEERIKKDLLPTKWPKTWLVLDTLPLPHLGAILERCCTLVGNDSGITHMAAALGVPVVALFGPTDPVRWAPRGAGVNLIRRDLPCSPCGRDKMVRCPFRWCLVDISLDEVWQAVGRIIRRRATKRYPTEDDSQVGWEKSQAAGVA
jgi:ADP-heptose:LPS heptosyltransferase